MLANNFWDSEGPVLVVEKNEKSQFRCNVVSKGTYVGVHIREWYQPKDSEDWFPGKQGMTMPFEVAEKVLKSGLKAVKIYEEG
jgi:hypothetical protein